MPFLHHIQVAAFFPSGGLQRNLPWKLVITMKLKWDIDTANFHRGDALEAQTNCSLDDLRSPLTEAWKKVIEITNTVRKGDDIRVLAEVWPDTGRVVFRAWDRREFARVILSSPALESCYYEISELDEEEFERRHALLVDSILTKVNSVIGPPPSDCSFTVVGRSSDDADTERTLHKGP